MWRFLPRQTTPIWLPAQAADPFQKIGFNPESNLDMPGSSVINNQTGNLTHMEQIISALPGEGGLGVPVSLIYNSEIWEKHDQGTVRNTYTRYSALQGKVLGWSFHMGRLISFPAGDSLGNVIFEKPDGSTATVMHLSEGYIVGPFANPYQAEVTGDGSFLRGQTQVVDGMTKSGLRDGNGNFYVLRDIWRRSHQSLWCGDHVGGGPDRGCGRAALSSPTTRPTRPRSRKSTTVPGGSPSITPPVFPATANRR